MDWCLKVGTLCKFILISNVEATRFYWVVSIWKHFLPHVWDKELHNKEIYPPPSCWSADIYHHREPWPWLLMIEAETWFFLAYLSSHQFHLIATGKVSWPYSLCLFGYLMSYTSTWLWRSWLCEGAWATTLRVRMQWLFYLHRTTMLCRQWLSCLLDAGTCIDHLSRSPQVLRSTTYKQVYLFQIHKPGSELLTRCDAFPFRMQSLCGMHLGCLTSCIGSKKFLD